MNIWSLIIGVVVGVVLVYAANLFYCIFTKKGQQYMKTQHTDALLRKWFAEPLNHVKVGEWWEQ